MGKRLKGVALTMQRNWYVVHRESIEHVDLIYEPFWRTKDIPSFGVKTKILHFEIPYRIVHLLSQNELWAYLELIRNPLVIEVYEQYALPLEETLASAEFLGVKHPGNLPIEFGPNCFLLLISIKPKGYFKCDTN